MSAIICLLAFAILWARDIVTQDELFSLTLGALVGITVHWLCQRTLGDNHE